MTDKQKKILANLIKADLQDALTNDSRWKVEGVSHYFQDYSMFRKNIFVDTNNKEIEKVVAENARHHSSQRKEKWEKEKRLVEKQGEKWSGNAEFKLHENQIQSDELEAEDYQEIVRLISKEIKTARDKKDQQKKQWVEEKLSEHPKMVYWGSLGKRSSVISIFKTGSWYSFERKENGQEYSFYIPQNHPDLTNFPFEKEGFYLIDFSESIPLQPYAEKGHVYWKKFLSLNDKITITPYEVENDSELSENKKEELKAKDCDTCQKSLDFKDSHEKWYNIRRYHGQNGEIIHVCPNCYKNKEQEYLQNYENIFSFHSKDLTHEGIPFLIENIKKGKMDCYAGKKDSNGKILQQQNCSHCQPWKKHKGTSNPSQDKDIINLLIQYFQQHSIKKIKFDNGKLIIIHNNNSNNETASSNEISSSQELQLAQRLIQNTNQQELTKEILSKMANTSTTPTEKPKSTEKPKNNYALPLTFAIGGALIIGVVVGLLVARSRKVKNN